MVPGYLFNLVRKATASSSILWERAILSFDFAQDRELAERPRVMVREPFHLRKGRVLWNIFEIGLEKKNPIAALA